MGRRYAMLEKDNHNFIIRYPLEIHNNFNEIRHDTLQEACNDLIRSIVLFSYDKDRINIYSDIKYFKELNIQIEKQKDFIKIKKLNIKLKDINER